MSFKDLTGSGNCISQICVLLLFMTAEKVKQTYSFFLYTEEK